MTDPLLQVALAGTGRTAPQPIRAEGPAEALGENMGPLLRAGLRDVYRRAGHVPPRAPEPFPPAPDVPETVCPPAVDPAVREMIERRSSLPSAPREAFRALAARRWVLPPRLLVLALSTRIEVAELGTVLGARGRWLASLNEDWRWAVDGDHLPEPSEVERVWAEGTKGQRVALIRRLREIDPTAARERMAARVASEPADLRQELVRTLEINLSPADEPLLETALDDRSKGVRQAATSLLARLPESAFVARMVSRARTLVTRGPGHDVTLMPAPTPPSDWRRDGIGLPAPLGRNDGYAWTIQVLSSIPPAVLAQELTVAPEDVLADADRYDGTPLIAAWVRSASSAERGNLLPFLWDQWWEKPLKRTLGTEALALLTRTLPPDALRQRVLKLLDEPPVGSEPFITVVLSEMGEPWPGAVSRAVLDLLRRWLDRAQRKARDAGDWLQIIGPLAAHAAPGTIDAALDLLSAIERARVVPVWNYEVRQTLDVLRLRQRFWDAIAIATIG